MPPGEELGAPEQTKEEKRGLHTEGEENRVPRKDGVPRGRVLIRAGLPSRLTIPDSNPLREVSTAGLRHLLEGRASDPPCDHLEPQFSYLQNGNTSHLIKRFQEFSKTKLLVQAQPSLTTSESILSTKEAQGRKKS